jgi:hypothetical protein
LDLGDNRDHFGADFYYQRVLFDSFPEILKNTPIWPTPGDLDFFNPSYTRIFDLPAAAEAGGQPSGSERFYSFDHGNIHFVSLDSNQNPENMIAWLHEDLSSTRADWIIAYFHHSPYPDSNFNTGHGSDARRKLVPVLEQYGVDLVLSGAREYYERTHLIRDLTTRSISYDLQKNSLNPTPGSPLGVTDPESGFLRYTNDFAPYQKNLSAPRSGLIAINLGTTSRVGEWNSGNRYAISNPTPLPAHVTTLRVHGSMVIDVEGTTLNASFLDLNGQVRDHFQIDKVPEVSPAIDWWKENFGTLSYPSIADWLANPDDDSFDNLAEFVHGQSPIVRDPKFPFALKVDETYPYQGQFVEWFTIRYPVREGAIALGEFGGNLKSFTSIYPNTSSSDARTLRITPPDSDGIALWESRIRRANRRALFFRLRTRR